jgi:hypothetical protein
MIGEQSRHDRFWGAVPVDDDVLIDWFAPVR